MSANKERGEIAIELGGTEYILRPSFDALCRIEQGIGTTIHRFLFQTAVSRDVGVMHVATIITEGIRGSGVEPPSKDDMGRMLFEEGVEHMSAVAIEFLNNAMVGPKNLKALPDETTGPTTD